MNNSFNLSVFLDSKNNWRQLPNGSVIIPATFTKIGVFNYDNLRILRSPKEVFKKESLNSMLYAPITNEHPSEFVDINNWYQYVKGIITNAFVDGEYISGEILIWDKDFLEILKEKKELSMGYYADLKASDSADYDYEQINIRYNHVSLVLAGRMGDTRILDSKEENKTNMQENEKQKIIDTLHAEVSVLKKEIEKLELENKKLHNYLEQYEIQKVKNELKEIGFSDMQGASVLELKTKLVKEFLKIGDSNLSSDFIEGAYNTILQLEKTKKLKDLEKTTTTNSSDFILDLE